MKTPKYFKIFSFILVSFLLLFSTQQAKAQTQTAKYVSMISNSNGYYEYLPQGYSATGTQTYPLLIFIHGLGELGNGSASQLSKVLANGVPKVINQGRFPTSFTVNNQVFRFIVISPQFIKWPQPADIDNIITYASRQYKVDVSRIYVTGLSMGGGATWDYAGNKEYAYRIAGIVPVCGASYPDNTRARKIATANLPVWATHNDGDPTAPVSYTNDYIAKINAAPAPVPAAKKTIFQSNSHDAWTKTYDPSFRENGLNVYEWMLQYKRGAVSQPSNIPPIANAGPDKNIVLPTNIVSLTGSATDQDGTIASYQWSKASGPTSFSINNATSASATVSGLVAGTYTFRLSVKDNSGTTDTDDVNVVVATEPTSGGNNGSGKSIQVNLFGGSNSFNNSAWNNWNTYGSLTSPAFKYSDGTTSSVGARLTQQSAVSDNGSSYKPTMAPAAVIRYASYSTTNRSLTITGLDNSITYNLELYASRNGVSNNTTRFTIGSATVNVKTDNNLSTKASFAGLKPTNGQIVVNISHLNKYNYLNGFILTESQAATASRMAATTAVQETSSAISVYPNPVTDKFSVQVNNEQTGSVKIQVTDINGNVKKNYSFSKTQTGIMQMYLSIGDLAAGEYILQMQIGNWTATEKIIKY